MLAEEEIMEVEGHPIWHQEKLRDYCKQKITAYSPLAAPNSMYGTNNVIMNSQFKPVLQTPDSSQCMGHNRCMKSLHEIQSLLSLMSLFTSCAFWVCLWSLSFLDCLIYLSYHGFITICCRPLLIFTNCSTMMKIIANQVVLGDNKLSFEPWFLKVAKNCIDSL